MRHAAMAISLAWSACTFSPARTLVSEPLPEEVEYTALLFADDGGRIFSSTGLVPREPDEPIGVPLPDAIEDAAVVHLLGFRRSDLAKSGFDERDASMPLSIATPIDPVLPPPAWYGMSRIHSGRGTLERGSTPPLVTAPWLSPCASLVDGDAGLVDSNCYATFCGLTVEQTGCAVSIRPSDASCSPEELTGRIDGRGALAFEACTTIEPHSGASGAIRCSGIRPFDCHLEIHPKALEPQLRAISVELFPPASSAPDDPHPVVIGGHLFGLEVFDDRIVVASDGGRAAWRNECPTATPGVLHFLDPETLAPIGTAESPPCLRELVRIPGREEMFAVFGAEDDRKIGRFAKDGTLLEEAAIPERIGIDYPASIVVHEKSDRVSVFFDGNDSVQYFVFRRTPLAWEWSSEVFEHSSFHQEREENIIAILERRQDEIHLLDVTKPPADVRSPAYPTNSGVPIRFHERCEDIDVRAEEMIFLPDQGWLVGSRDATTGLMAIFSLDASDCDVVRWFEGPAEIFDFMLWPANQNLVLTGIRRTDDGTARVALMNRREARFLTGSIEVGTGAIDDMRADGSGRVYLTLPWSARVVRVERR